MAAISAGSVTMTIEAAPQPNSTTSLPNRYPRPTWRVEAPEAEGDDRTDPVGMRRKLQHRHQPGEQKPADHQSEQH